MSVYRWDFGYGVHAIQYIFFCEGYHQTSSSSGPLEKESYITILNSNSGFVFRISIMNLNTQGFPKEGEMPKEYLCASKVARINSMGNDNLQNS